MAVTPRSRATSRPRRRRSWPADVHLVSLGGDHFVTWPLLQAHAAVHGPLALVQLDAHQDTWSDDGDRLDHGTFVGRAVRAGLIDPARSIQVGIRTHAPEDCGIEIVDGYTVHELGVRATAERVLARVGDAPGLSHGRHRLPRPGLRARAPARRWRAASARRKA